MRKIVCLADIEALEQQDLPLIKNTYHVFLESEKKYSNNTAMRFLLNGDALDAVATYTYKDLLEKITQTANALFHLGITHQDVVSLLLPNLPQTHFAIWGASATGIVNPINPLLEPEQIISIMNAAQSKVLITLAPSTHPLLWEKVAVISEKVPTLKTILVIDLARFSDEEVLRPLENLSVKKQILDFDYFISQQRSDVLENTVQPEADDIACYLHTGGTTGSPKLAMLSHANLTHSAWSASTLLDFKADDILLASLPLFHVFAVIGCGLSPFMVGAEILLASPQGFRDETVIYHVWRILEKYNVTVLLAVPAIFNILSSIPIHDYDLSKVRYSVSGSAPLPIQTLHNFEKHTGIKIHEGYGMTESACIISVNPQYIERKIGSVGLRIPFQEMKAIKVNEQGDYLQDCDVNELGHVVVRGRNIFKGYKNSQSTFLPGGWFDTGDLGYQDSEGCFWLKGRSKDIIIRGGHNIDPQIIEEILYQHPAVLAAAAIGKPDNKVGELPVAYVSLRLNESVDEQELLMFISERIVERAAIPKNIYIIDAMPMTAVGKIFKPKLRMDVIQRLFTENLSYLMNKGIQYSVSVDSHITQGQSTKVTLLNKDADSELTNEIKQIFKNYNLTAEVIYN